jgi:hypothetical protein
VYLYFIALIPEIVASHGAPPQTKARAPSTATAQPRRVELFEQSLVNFGQLSETRTVFLFFSLEPSSKSSPVQPNNATNKTGPGSTCACTSPTKRAVLESPTTPSAGTLRRTTNARFVALLGTLARPPQQVWLPGHELQDPSTWDAPPLLCTLKSLHVDLLQNYNCSDLPAAAQPAPPSEQAAALLPTRAKTRSPNTQAPRTTATENSFFRSSTASTRHSSGVRFPRHVPAQDQHPTRPSPIPSQRRLTSD